MKPICFASTLVVVFLLGAGTAGAGHLTATYDLAGSTVQTTTPLGTFTDPLSGTVTIVYVTATEFETPSVGFIKSGAQHLTINQPSPGVLTLTGTADTTWGSAPATLSGATFSQASGTTGDTTGFLHCFGGLCGLAGFTASVPLPQTRTAPFTLPPLVFTSGNAGVGNFTGMGTGIVTTPATVTVVSSYVGTEISRTFVPEPGALPMLAAGIVCLGRLGSRRARRRR